MLQWIYKALKSVEINLKYHGRESIILLLNHLSWFLMSSSTVISAIENLFPSPPSNLFFLKLNLGVRILLYDPEIEFFIYKKKRVPRLYVSPDINFLYYHHILAVFIWKVWEVVKQYDNIINAWSTKLF